MPTVKEIRQTIDQTLDRWEAAASTLEANAQATSDAVSERLQKFKSEASVAADKLQEAASHAQQMPEEARDQLTKNIALLRSQLELGQAAAYDAVLDQQKKISEAVQLVESEIDKVSGQMGDAYDRSVADWVRAQQELKQQMDLAEIRFQHEKEKTQAQFEAQQQTLLDNVKQFREMFEQQAAGAQQKGATFAKDMNASFEQALDAFRKLSKQ
jgi:hypothetical protein